MMRPQKRKQPSGARKLIPQEDSASELVGFAAVSDWMRWRAVNVSAQILIHQPLEPARTVACRLFNERLVILAREGIKDEMESTTLSTPSPLEQNGRDGKSGSHRSASHDQSPPPSASPHVFGKAFRQWTATRLVPYGVEALNAYQLPAIAHASDCATADMLATVAALLYRQSRAAPAEKKNSPPPVPPLFFDADDEISVSLAVPFLLALIEQQLRGVAPGLTPWMLLSCSTLILHVLALELSIPRCDEDSLEQSLDGESFTSAAQPACLTESVAAVASLAQVGQLALYLCKCVNRMAPSSRAKGGRSARSSTSSTRNSQPRTCTPASDQALSSQDLDALVESLYSPRSLAGAPPTVSAAAMRRVLRVLTVALWGIYNVGVPLAALLSSYDARQRAAEALRAFDALSRNMQAAMTANPPTRTVQVSELGLAEAMLLEDFVSALRTIVPAAEPNLSIRVGAPPQVLPRRVAALDENAGEALSVDAERLWLQATAWVLQVVECVATAHYTHGDACIP